MPRPDSNGSLLAPWWTLALPLVVLGALVVSPPERRLWVAPISVAVFGGLQWALPRCRFRTAHYLGPVNVALFLLFLKLVIMPMVIMITGPGSKVLTYLPSLDSMQNAMLIDIVAYTAFCVGLSLQPTLGRQDTAPLAALAGPGPTGGLVTLFAALGIIGFVAAFGSPGRLIDYFLDSNAKLQDEMEASLTALAGTFLRPFFAFALVAWWSRHVDASTGRERLWWPTLTGIVAAVGVTLANLTFSFNRAAFVFPLVSLFAVYSARVRRVPAGLTMAAGMMILPLLMGLETMRSNRALGLETHSIAPWESVLQDAAENIKGYGGGPQFAAIFCERLGWGEQLYGGSTLISSIMSPVPVLGKGFREGSGPALFNQAIYDVRDIEDQILPFSIELFVNFHLPGVVAGMAGLGLFLSAAQHWFERAESAFAAFSIQYVAMWGAMLAAWSASIYSQIIIYFFGPIYFYIACKHGLEWLSYFGRRRHFVSTARTRPI